MAASTKGIEQTVAALGRMTVAQLREKYLEVFGEPSRSGNRDFLFKRVAWRVQSLAEGGLSERAKRRAEELARDADIRTTMPRTPATTAHAAARTAVAPVLKTGWVRRHVRIAKRPTDGKNCDSRRIPATFHPFLLW